MHEAFLKLWKRWDRIESIDDPVAYLFRTALNGFRMRVRRTRVAARRLMPVAATYESHVLDAGRIPLHPNGVTRAKEPWTDAVRDYLLRVMSRAIQPSGIQSGNWGDH